MSEVKFAGFYNIENVFLFFWSDKDCTLTTRFLFLIYTITVLNMNWTYTRRDINFWEKKNVIGKYYKQNILLIRHLITFIIYSFQRL